MGASRANAHLTRVCAVRYGKEREIYGSLVVVSSGYEKRPRVRRFTRGPVMLVAFRRRLRDNREKFIRLILAILRAPAD